MNIQEENNQKLIRFNIEVGKFSLIALRDFFKFIIKNINKLIEENKTQYKLSELVKKRTKFNQNRFKQSK